DRHARVSLQHRHGHRQRAQCDGRARAAETDPAALPQDRQSSGPADPRALGFVSRAVSQSRAPATGGGTHGTGGQPPINWEPSMKLITTIVRPDRVPEVKAALFRAGITGITLSRVSGHGGEHERFEQYRGTALVMEFHEKVKIEMVCSEPFVEPCVQAILSSARTGEVGDGKIFIQPIERVVRIRTGEVDNAALTAVNADAVQRAAINAAGMGGAA